MAPTNPIPAALAILVALIVCLVLVKKFGPPDEQGRFLAIDGLRGYLAFCVFLHHSIIWFFYLKTDQWTVPPSNLYTHFGQTGVAFFFMITGFLFFSKILDGKSTGIDWLRLYVSRFLRLMPLYCVAMIVLLLIVFSISGARLHESIGVLILEIFRWMSFTALGAPDINGVEKTGLIMAGVTWSLPYEWKFYFLLPIFAVLNKVRVGRVYLVIGLVVAISILAKGKTPYYWLSFIGGIFAAYVVRSEDVCIVLRNRFSSIAAILLIVVTIEYFQSPYGLLQICMLSGAFVVIASGNGIFGLLTNELSRTLGAMAYGIYILHGLLLSVLFRFVIGLENSKALTPISYWASIIGVAPVLLGVAYLCYRKIERPALLKTTALTLWLRKKISFNSKIVEQKI